jgi:signal transduction histidine kinase
MPRWFMTLRLTGDDPFAAAAKRQEAAYLWIGSVGIAAIMILGLAMALYLRRQMQLTRLKNDLIATVSHELKTPLSSMRVLVDTLVEGRCHTGEQEKEYLGLIARENARLSRLIDNFLTFSRMERNKHAFTFGRVEVADVARSAIEAMGERACAAAIRVEIAPGLPPVHADHDALVTVIVNLLDNAWKYSGENKNIELAAFAEAQEVCLAVKDHGIGIARRHQRRIFQRFYQVDQTLSRKTGGCGLGLSIVRFIVEAHGGRIDLESQLGQGSTFTVRLPAAAPARATARTVEAKGGIADGR